MLSKRYFHFVYLMTVSHLWSFHPFFTLLSPLLPSQGGGNRSWPAVGVASNAPYSRLHGEGSADLTGIRTALLPTRNDESMSTTVEALPVLGHVPALHPSSPAGCLALFLRNEHGPHRRRAFAQNIQARFRRRLRLQPHRPRPPSPRATTPYSHISPTDNHSIT